MPRCHPPAGPPEGRRLPRGRRAAGAPLGAPAPRGHLRRHLPGAHRRLTALEPARDINLNERRSMARKPNYNFERQERERAKAIKLAEKAAAKREQRERGKPLADDDQDPPSEDA